MLKLHSLESLDRSRAPITSHLAQLKVFFSSVLMHFQLLVSCFVRLCKVVLLWFSWPLKPRKFWRFYSLHWLLQLPSVAVQLSLAVAIICTVLLGLACPICFLLVDSLCLALLWLVLSPVLDGWWKACAFSLFLFSARLACGWSFVGRGLYCVSWPRLWVILFLPYFFVVLILLPLKVAICQGLVGSLLWVLNGVESNTFRIVGSHPFRGC